MSKVGAKPIIIPSGVTVKIEAGLMKVAGPKGELTLKFRPEIKVSEENIAGQKQLKVVRKNDTKFVKSLHGLFRSLMANMIIGVTEGFSKSLKIIGTGYRANLEGKNLVLNVGFSHPVIIEPMEGIEFTVKGNNEVIIGGRDKQLVGQVAASIRQIKKPDAYKGKGIRYKDEIVKKKPGKAVKAGPAA